MILLPVALLVCIAVGACGGRSEGGEPPRSFYGVTPSTPLTPADFARMRKAGVGSFRFTISWPAIQLQRGGAYNWAGIDSTVASAAREGFDLLPTLSGMPRFQAPPGCRQPACPLIHVDTSPQRARWKQFVRAAVNRYGPDGTFWKEQPTLAPDPARRWEIWNEQNNPREGNSPAVYATLIRLSKEAITAVDPQGQVIVGGMFGTPQGVRGKNTAWRYLGRLYRAGAGRDFDAAALHPYSPTIAGLRYQIRKVRAVLRKNNAASTPILVTEIGWASGGNVRSPGTGARGQVFVVSPKRQAQNLSSSFRLLTNHRRAWNIGGVFWYGWKDPTNPPPGLCAFCYTNGLYEADGKTAKPSLSAFESFTGRASPGG